MNIAFDKEGYLVNQSDWNKDIANAIANQENIILTEKHWLIINALRDFYQQYKRIPSMRVLIKTMTENLPTQKITSPYLYTLFPDGPIKQGCKIAGLPKPVHCI